MLLVTKTRYFGREVGPSLAVFVETKTNDFRQEIKPPAVLSAKETSFFWWQENPAIFGEVGPFLCWPKLCISLRMEGHLEPCHWPSSAMLLASKTSDFFIGIWSIFGHFCANKMAIFSQEIGLSPAALLATKTDRFWQKSDHPQAFCSHQERYFKPNHEVFVRNLKQSSTTALRQERLILNICKVMNIYVGNWVYPAHLWLVSCYRGEHKGFFAVFVAVFVARRSPDLFASVMWKRPTS